MVVNWKNLSFKNWKNKFKLMTDITVLCSAEALSKMILSSSKE